jgi:exo-1,4-beta-D-glucosaminidase
VRLLSKTSEGKLEEILPVRWDDNYIALMPGEMRTLEAHIHDRDWNKRKLSLRVKGWNVEPLTVNATD